MFLSYFGADVIQCVANVQASLQEKVQLHKDTMEDIARLRMELLRLSDDRDQLANQVNPTIPTNL